MTTTEKLPEPRIAREAKGLRREDLATAAGVSLTTVAHCEQRKVWPVQTLVLARYLAALGLTEPVRK